MAVAQCYTHPVSRQPSFERLYPDPETGPYRLRVWIDRVNGRLGVVGVELWGVEPELQPWQERTVPKEPGASVFGLGAPADPLPEKAVTAAAVRLKLGAILNDWVAANKALAKAALKMGASRRDVAALRRSLDKPKPGRPRLSETLLRMVADEHQRALLVAPNAPTREVQHRLLKDPHLHLDVNVNTIRSWVKAAKDRDLYYPKPTKEEP